MSENHRRPPWPRALAGAHAILFLAFAGVCYLAPQAAFGDAAWQPLARLAVGLLAATLVSLAVVLVGAARSGSLRTLRPALFAALVVDVQVPILLTLHPVAFEYLERDIGFPWFLTPLAFFALVAVTVASLSSLREGSGADAGS